jgi:hypothetical protein
LTWPTTLPVAALRVLRTAAGRRALRVAVVVGGLFALGFLCGEQAHAAEGAPLVTSTSFTSPAAVPADPLDGVRSQAKDTVGRLGKPHTPTDPIVRPLTDGVVRSLADRVVRPVGGLVETMTAELGTVTARIPPLPSSPDLPSVPPAPGLPVPGQTQTRPTPVEHAPQPGGTGQSGTGESVDGGRPRAEARASTTAYGPRAGAGLGGASHDAMAQATGPRVTGPGVAAPAHQAPDGTLTSAATAAVDEGAPRHGEGHAVALNHRAPLRLVPGAAVHAAAAENRDSHGDIPFFPGQRCGRKGLPGSQRRPVRCIARRSIARVPDGARAMRQRGEVPCRASRAGEPLRLQH